MVDKELLQELREIKELLRIIASNTEQKEITVEPISQLSSNYCYEDLAKTISKTIKETLKK